MAARYAHRLELAFINVCGASSSGGVEANFVVNYAASRKVNPGYDKQLNFTLDNYVGAWHRQIDSYLPLFRRLGMATHDKPGPEGWDASSETVLMYDVAAQMAAARSIKNHLIVQHTTMRPYKPILRCCGGTNRTAEWGVPNSTADKPPSSTYALLMWESRMQADIGFEPAKVESIGPNPTTPTNMATMLDIDLYYNGRYLEIKRPDVINNNNSVYSLYAADLVAAAARIDPAHRLPWNCTV
jgi:hypothetical protein